MPWFAFFLIVFFTLCFLQKVIPYVSKTWKTFPHASHLQRTRILTLWFHLRWVFMLPIGGNFSQHRSHWTNYQTQNRFHMLHIELGFLLHDFIRNSLQGFLNIYHIEWTIWVGSCILECGFLSSFLNVNWCKRPWKIQLHRLDNSVENVSWSLYASLFHALLGDLKIQTS